MANEYPTLNGVAPSWGDLEGPSFIIYGGPTIQIADLSAIKWEESLNVGTKRGAGGRKTGRTTGEGDSNGGITFYEEGWQTLLDGLMTVVVAKGLKGYGMVPFDVVYQFSPPNSSKTRLLKIESARVVKCGGGGAEGPDPNKIETDLNVMRVLQNGASMS